MHVVYACEICKKLFNSLDLAIECEKTCEKNKIKNARKVMADAFKEDPDFKQVYIANVAMLLFDRGWMKNPYDDRSEAAEAVLDLIFEDKR